MNQEPLWPYGTRGALIAALAAWLIVTLILAITSNYLGWPNEKSIKLAALIVIALGLLPIGLRLLDFIATQRAVVDIKGVKIDFSRVDLDQPQIRRETPGIPDNIGISGPIVSDTSPMDIIQTLKDVARTEIVVIDLKQGEAWWVTRLLALSAGAVRAGAPQILVFIGQKQSIDHQFLGWAVSGDVLLSILRDNDQYRIRYDKAMRISKQVFMYGSNEFLPQQPAPFLLHMEVNRYTNTANPDSKQFAKLGPAVAEQILMDQLALSYPEPSLEEPPDRLTLGRLYDLFGHCLHNASIDLSWPKKKQVSCLLESLEAYTALVRAGRYESMIKKGDGERLLIRELLLPAHREPSR
jgi:hypothetical protein